MTMKTLYVDGMHCGHCVARIQKALGAAGLKFTVSLEDKTVTVDGDDAQVKTAVSEIEDLGFDVRM